MAALAVALPGLGAIATLILWRRTVAVAALAATATLGAVAGLAHGVWVQQAAVRVAVGRWQPPLGIELRADGLSVLMLCLSGCVMALTGVYASRYLDHGRAAGKRHFWPLAMLLWMGLNALFLASDAFNLYVTLEVVSLSGVALTALGGDRAALAAALRYLFAGMLASLLYLLGVALLYIEHGTLSLTALGAALGASRAGPLATALILTGLLFKGALFPLHFWLPTAHANAPAPVSALLSALVVKAALYLLLRWWLEVWGPGLSWGVAQLIGTLGALAVLWGSTQALLAPRLKLVVAYSTVAQMGYLLLIFPLAHDATAMALVWSGVVYFAISHGLAKAAMFLAAGNAMRLHGHDNIAGLAGLGAHMPVSAFAMALAGISLIGLPFSGGFVGKWLMLNAALAAGQWWWLMLLALGSLLAAAYVFRVLRLIFVTPEHTPAGRLPGALEWPALLLALAAIVLGFTFTALAPLIDIGAPGAALGLRP